MLKVPGGVDIAERDDPQATNAVTDPARAIIIKTVSSEARLAFRGMINTASTAAIQPHPPSRSGRCKDAEPPVVEMTTSAEIGPGRSNGPDLTMHAAPGGRPEQEKAIASRPCPPGRPTIN